MLRLIAKYFHLLLLVPLILACEDCRDCGPSKNEPYVNLKFYNIDSLLKVNAELDILADSLEVVDTLIKKGDTTLTETRDMLAGMQTLYKMAQSKINAGMIKINEVSSLDDDNRSIVFRDSAKNDSLTLFRFPLSMNKDESAFSIDIQGNKNQISFAYTRTIDKAGDQILVHALNLEVIDYSYDSVKVNCGNSSCLSNETHVNIYF